MHIAWLSIASFSAGHIQLRDSIKWSICFDKLFCCNTTRELFQIRISQMWRPGISWNIINVQALKMCFVMVCVCDVRLQNHRQSRAHTRVDTQRQYRRCVAQPEAICLPEWLLMPSYFRQTVSHNKTVFFFLKVFFKYARDTSHVGLKLRRVCFNDPGSEVENKYILVQSQTIYKPPVLYSKTHIITVALEISAVTEYVRTVKAAVLTAYSILTTSRVVNNKWMFGGCLILSNIVTLQCFKTRLEINYRYCT